MTVFIFTGEFIDYTDNIISFTVSFINMFISYCIAAHYPSSDISQLSHDKNYCCANAVMYMYYNFFSSPHIFSLYILLK